MANYDNERPYNNAPIPAGNILAPIMVDEGTIKMLNIDRNNIETWHIGSCRFRVAFIPVAEEQFDVTMKVLWSSIREEIRNHKSGNELSYEQFLEDAAGEDGSGYDPGQTESHEERLILSMTLDWLFDELDKLDPTYGMSVAYLAQVAEACSPIFPPLPIYAGEAQETVIKYLSEECLLKTPTMTAEEAGQYCVDTIN